MSTRALQFELLLNGILHPTTGAPLNAGTVDFFAAGTTDPKDVWTEKEKTNDYTSITLAADGTALIYGDGNYKLVIKDSAGTPIAGSPRDNVRCRYPNYAVVSKSDTYTITPDDDLILVDTTGGNVTLNMEAAANFDHPVIVKNIGTNNAIIDPNESETIDGSDTLTIAVQYQTTSLASDGSNWYSTSAVGAASTAAAGIVELLTAAELATGTDMTRAATAAAIAAMYGHETEWIDAAAMTPTETNGAAPGSNEYATNDIAKDYLAFDGATEEFADFNFPMPEAWDRGTIKAKFFWAPGHSDCTAGDTVEFKLAGQAISDDDPLDVAMGDAGEVISDTVLVGKDADLHISGATPAITIGGTPALGDLAQFKVSRNVGGTDDMTEDAWLFGVLIQYKKANTVAAW